MAIVTFRQLPVSHCTLNKSDISVEPLTFTCSALRVALNTWHHNITHSFMQQPLVVSLPQLAVNQHCCLAGLSCLLDQACIAPQSCQHRHPAELPVVQLGIMHLQQKKQTGPQATSSDAMHAAFHDITQPDVGQVTAAACVMQLITEAMSTKRSHAMCTTPPGNMTS